MKNYLYALCSIIVLLSFAETVCCNGKNSKSLKYVLSLIAVTVILSPIVKIFNYKGDFSDFEESFNAYNDYYDNLSNKILEEQLKQVLINENYKILSVNVENSQNEEDFKNITINFENEVIFTETEHKIFIEKVKTLIQNYKLYNGGVEIFINGSKKYE